MSKADQLPKLMPAFNKLNLRGLTLDELYTRQRRNDYNMEILKTWLNEFDSPATYEIWKDFDGLRKRINRTIYLKRLKLWLLSLVGH
jgi:hypothetical protein